MSIALGPKDPDIDTEYAIDARASVLLPIRRDWPYLTGALAKHPRHTGYYYECTTAGETKTHWPPAWPIEEGETVNDGSVQWTTRHPSSASLPSVSAVDWTVSPSGLTVADERFESGIVYPTVADGTDGVDYEVTARITWSNGHVEDVTVIIPVRAQ